MNTLKLTSIFAVMAMMASVAFAQPQDSNAPPPPPTQAGAGQHHPGMAGRMGGDGGPYLKLMAASKLASLTPEQKTKIDAIVEQKKAEMQASREELKAAVEKARAATDPQARREAMEPLRQKQQALQQEVDTNLKSILKPEQLAELDKQASEMRSKMGERMRGARPGAADEGTSSAANAAHEGRRGEKGKREGKAGKRHKNANANADGATSGTATNPFSGE